MIYVFARWSTKIVWAFAKFRDGRDSGSNTIILSLRDGSLLLLHSRHFVPGYSHESLRDNRSPADNS